MVAHLPAAYVEKGVATGLATVCSVLGLVFLALDIMVLNILQTNWKWKMLHDHQF